MFVLNLFGFQIFLPVVLNCNKRFGVYIVPLKEKVRILFEKTCISFIELSLYHGKLIMEDSEILENYLKDKFGSHPRIDCCKTF